MNLDCIGRTYQVDSHTVHQERAVAYALATSDPHPAALAGEVAPLLYPVVPFLQVMGRALMDRALQANVMRLVHGEQELVFHRPLLPGETLETRATITDIEQKATGEVLTLHQVLEGPEDVPCEAISAFFIRAPRKPGEERPKKTPWAPPSEEPAFTTTVEVGAEQSLAYAEASGDRNPIHVDEATARAVGLPGIILHGLCTMAMVGHAVCTAVAEGQPERIARYRVRFARPVQNGDILTIRGWWTSESDGNRSLTVAAWNQRGEAVVTQGRVELRD